MAPGALGDGRLRVDSPRMSDAGGSALSRQAWARLVWLAERASPADPAGWAVRQGVGPLVLAGEGDAAWADSPALRESRWRAEALWEARAVHLERCLEVLARAGVRSVVLKGAALAVAHYPHPALRPMADLDVLVAPGQRAAAVRALQAVGWTLEEDTEHAAALAGPGGGRLELHGSLTSCPAVFPIRFDDLYGRALPLPIVDGMRLSDEDMLLHLGLHTAFQHGLRVRLGQYADFGVLLGRALDWDRVTQVAARARGLAALASSLAVHEALLGAAPPPETRARLDGVVPGAVRRWLRQRGSRPWKLLEGLGVPRARWAVVRGAAWKARLLAGTLCPGRPDGSREVIPWNMLRRGARLARQSAGPVRARP